MNETNPSLRYLPLAIGGAALLALPFLFLGGAQPPQPLPAASPPSAEALAAEVTRLAQRLAVLEGRPAPAPAASGPALLPAPPGPSALPQRIDALEARFGDAQARLAAAEAAAGTADRRAAAAVEAATAAREAAIAARETAAAVGRRAEAAEQAAAAAATRLAALETRAARLAAQERLRDALENGRALGPLLARLPGGAPAALSRYAEAAPPTETALRAGFEEAARAARQAAQAQGRGFGGLLTVRRGDEVVVGDPGEAEIERARRALAASDINGALERLGRISGPAREALAPWLGQAEALAAARAAIAGLGGE